MLRQSFIAKMTLVATVLTLVALWGYQFIPHKYLKLNPKDYANANYFLLPISNDPDRKKIYWVDDKPFHFHCKFDDKDHGAPCNLIFLLSEDNIHGKNLTGFNELRFKLKYQGSAKNIRVAVRNFDPHFSNVGDGNSSKFMSVSLRTKDLGEKERINLHEFAVGEWWLDQFNLPRDLTHPDWSNLVTFSLDFVGDLAGTEHDVNFSDIEFVGDWITKEEWYFFILIAWIIVGALTALLRLIYLTRRGHRQEARISELVVRNSKLSRETDKFRKLSTVDVLTNAFNRYGIEQIVETLETKTEKVSLIVFDLDHFKRINDKRGHDAGDRVLQGVSEIVLTKTRSSDRFGRWGGEEFILICPNTSVGMATALAEKLRILIFDTIFEANNPISVAASFGVAQMHPDEPFGEAFKRADEALYKAKSLGRNCVVVAAQDDLP